MYENSQIVTSFIGSIFAVVALFTKNIFIIKLYTQLLLHFRWEFLKSLHAFLLLFEDSLITTAVLLDHIWRGCYPFSLIMFSSKSCSCNSYVLNGNSLNLSILAYINIRVCILLQQFDWTIFGRVIVLFYLYIWIFHQKEKKIRRGKGSHLLFSSPGHRPCELLSWVSVHRPSISFSHWTLLLWNH